jgi:hypothetical protein
VVWGFLYGSDIALFLCLSLWLFERTVATWEGAIGSAAVAAALLSLARPEGLPIALILAVAWGVRGRGRVAWSPVACGLAVLGLNRVITGQWLGSSLADKSLFANYGIADGLAMLAAYAVDVIRGLLLGFYPSQTPIGLAQGWASFAFPPLGLLLVLLALAEIPAPLRTPARLWALVVALVCALDAPNVFLGVHFNRYILWSFPVLLVLVAVGLGHVTRLLARGDVAREGRLFAAGATLLLVLSAFSTLRFAALYGEMAGEIASRDVAAARWISRELPPGTPIANAITSVEYLTGHKNLNLHGVTSPAFFGGKTAEREASMLEGLTRLPGAERPEYLLTSVATQDQYVTLRELATGEALFQTLTGGDEILLLRTRWDAFERGSRPLGAETHAATAGLSLVDRLNVCDGPDEAAHGYAYTSTLGQRQIRGTARVAEYGRDAGGARVADAGRAILGSESFRVKTRMGADLVLVLRMAPSVLARIQRASGATTLGLDFAQARFEVSIGGTRVAETRLAPRAGWDEAAVRIPGNALAGGETKLVLTGRYPSFQYWFYQ